MVKLIFGDRPIRGVLLNAHIKRVGVEVRLDRQEELYGTHLLYAPFPVAERLEDLNLLIVPLEPAIGNAKIRGSQAVHLAFHMGYLLFSARSSFLRVMELHGQLVVQIAMPKVIQCIRRRSSARQEVKSGLGSYRVAIRSKGRTIDGELLDCSMTGMALGCKSLSQPLHRDDRVMLEIHYPEEKFAPLMLQGLVRYRTRFRCMKEMAVAQDNYGIQLMGMDLKQEYHIHDLLKRLAGTE